MNWIPSIFQKKQRVLLVRREIGKIFSDLNFEITIRSFSVSIGENLNVPKGHFQITRRFVVLSCGGKERQYGFGDLWLGRILNEACLHLNLTFRSFDIYNCLCQPPHTKFIDSHQPSSSIPSPMVAFSPVSHRNQNHNSHNCYVCELAN